MPHIVRTGLADCLGLPDSSVRVISPDVGGGFGYKGILCRRRCARVGSRLHLRHPVRWIEDRREQLTANANCREHHYDITGYADSDGRLLGIDCEAHVDAGAYSVYPFSSAFEAAQVASFLPGPYDFHAYRCRTCVGRHQQVSDPALSRRRAHRACASPSRSRMDAVARKAGIEPYEVRLRNLVRPEQMPSTTSRESTSTAATIRSACAGPLRPSTVTGVRARQKAGEADGRLIGVGFSIYCEQARTAPRSMPAGAFQWCPAMSRRSRA